MYVTPSTFTAYACPFKWPKYLKNKCPSLSQQLAGSRCEETHKHTHSEQRTTGNQQAEAAARVDPKIWTI